MHRRGPDLDDEALAALVADVRAAVVRATADALDGLAADVPGPIAVMCLRAWPPDFPADIATQRRVPYEAEADSVMYRQVLADAAGRRGWAVSLFDARHAESQAAAVLGARAEEVLYGPRARLGAPWAKDHRVALAATVLAAEVSRSP